MSNDQTIALYHPVLYSIAIKMVGSLEDAQDIVQDTFLKWLTIDQEKIKNTKSYLIKTVTNKCINHLNALKNKKNDFLDTLNPGSLFEKYKESDFAKFDLENEISEALVTLHKKLEPLEKAIFILREVFNFDYEDLQDIFDKKKENCRQLLCRAKDKLSQESKKVKIEFNDHTHFLEGFIGACTSGKLSDFVSSLVNEIPFRFNKTK
ncbi:sigma-70 family RNA polymerase sigma factor [Fulvivirgaceae bacterium BMA10]|uniref:Sigma-70 family RNA polymerase sigma factor n=1 Tax=Splendidivirga corallicola TaxID=3051826 RepID=A0ABT8KSB1_9BACT|nr:sigma-70 family RNA polymerase sigma factor [Fulvivirgaceae bacterium BMA10]